MKKPGRSHKTDTSVARVGHIAHIYQASAKPLRDSAAIGLKHERNL